MSGSPVVVASRCASGSRACGCRSGASRRRVPRRARARRPRRSRPARACRRTRARGSRARSRRRPAPRRARSVTAAGSRIPSATARSAASSARRSAAARSRSCAESWTLRLDIASPSGSRTVSQTSIRTGMFRSRTSRLIDHGLLSVLLSEVGDVRADHVEQLRDDGRDAVEVAGARDGRPRARRSAPATDTVVANPGG